MMQRQSITSKVDERLRWAVAQTFGLPVDEITDATSQATVAAWDSIGQLDLVIALEAEFGVSFTPEEILVMDGVAAIRSLLAQRGIGRGGK
jgi:acyl carrier protein